MIYSEATHPSTLIEYIVPTVEEFLAAQRFVEQPAFLLRALLNQAQSLLLARRPPLRSRSALTWVERLSL